MSVYTKTGDKGSTALFDGARVKKYDERVDTYGTFDELNASVSLATKYVNDARNRIFLEDVQRNLFYLCAELATEKADLTSNVIRITALEVKELETRIDLITANLPRINRFVLPGKCKASSHLHVSRTIARRAERLLVKLSETIFVRKEILQYINRLSDFLYILAREEDFQFTVSKLTSEIMSRYHAVSGVQIETIGVICMKKLTLSVFTELATAVEQVATSENVPVTMAIVGTDSQLLFHYRMTDALLVSTDLAKKKAYSAVAMKAETEALAGLVQPGAPLYQLEALTDGQVVTFGGGVPIYDENQQVIAGLGVSGGSVEEDVRIAKTALSIVGMR